MKYHKLLEKQIKKYLPESFHSDSEFSNFLSAINESYASYERDKELMNHAFSKSEEEYQEIYQDLNKEYILKQDSISKLYQSLKMLDENMEIRQSEDFGELSEYLSEQIRKRKSVEDQLSRQLEFQQLLMNISSEFINIPVEEINDNINSSLEAIARFVKADRIYVFKYDFQENTCSNLYEYCSEGIFSNISFYQNFPLEPFEKFVELHKQGKSITINNADDFPDKDLRDLLLLNNVKSVLAIPLMIDGKCEGFVGFDAVHQYRNFGNEENDLLKLFAQILANIRVRFFMESKLNRTLELLKTLLANLQYGILVEDENRRILFTNSLFCDMFSIPLSPETMQGIDCSNSAEDSKHLFANEERFPERINEILEERKIVTDELLETKAGRFLERDYIPIYINGKYRGHLWKYNDITESVLAKELLRQSEERNRLIMNSAINAIINADSEGKITFWNKRAEQIFGWKAEEITGKTLAETIIPEIHKKAHEEGMKNYMETGYGPVLNEQLELSAIRKSGEEFPIEISIIPIEQDGKKFFCSFIQDISKRKRAEENLKVQEQKYRNIIANMNLGLLEVDNNEVIQYANQSFCDVSGYEIDELIGKEPSKLFLYKENSIPLVEHHVSLRKKGLSSVYQVPVKNKRGELRWWAISAAPNYDDKGNLIGSVGIHLDITDQKHMEEALKKEKENAQEASKAKEAFLANMSHEIRTPLNAIIGFLRELAKQDLTSGQKQFVDNSNSASQHLLSIINNILDISKIEAGEMSLDIKDFSLQQTVNNVVNILQPKAVQKNIKLISVFPKDIAPVFRGDASKIEQILYNLIGNSLKFTNKGEIRVECTFLEDNPDKQKIKISVVDSGIGMSKEFIEKIFKKFYQEDASIARKVGGTGLGMAITKELVKLMQGSITIESEKEKGTKIDVTLVLPKGIPEKLENRSDFSQEISVEGTQVLLVEDSELNRLVAQNTLQNFKCIVTEAENGARALEILKEKSFDIILMDIQMPELDGIETTKILRKQYHVSTPIIALTANAFKTEVEKCRKAGMDSYITKPYSENELLETIYHYTKGKTEQEDTNEEAGIYNLQNLRLLSRGDESFVKKMITIFISQIENVLPQIHTSFVEKNYAEISRLTHKIKPSIEQIGIISITEHVKILEAKSKDISIDHQELYEMFCYIEDILSSAVRLLKEKEL